MRPDGDKNKLKDTQQGKTREKENIQMIRQLHVI